MGKEEKGGVEEKRGREGASSLLATDLEGREWASVAVHTGLMHSKGEN